MSEMTAIPKERLSHLAGLNEIDPTRRLVELAREGCAESFQRLVIDHQQLVRIFLAKYVHCQTQIEDLAQDVFVVAFKQLNKFRSESKFSTWLLGIARNKALYFVREEFRYRQKHQQFLQAEIAKRNLIRLEDDTDSDNEIQLAALKSCLQQLPKPSQALVNQFYFDEQSSEKIASQFKMKSSAIRMKLLRIRNVLKRCIGTKIKN